MQRCYQNRSALDYRYSRGNIFFLNFRYRKASNCPRFNTSIAFRLTFIILDRDVTISRMLISISGDHNNFEYKYWPLQKELLVVGGGLLDKTKSSQQITKHMETVLLESAQQICWAHVIPNPYHRWKNWCVKIEIMVWTSMKDFLV